MIFYLQGFAEFQSGPDDGISPPNTGAFSLGGDSITGIARSSNSRLSGMVADSDQEPDSDGSVLNSVAGSKSVFRIRIRIRMFKYQLKVHKNENFFGSDFDFVLFHC